MGHETFDILLTGGTIVDGSGNEPYRGDVAILGDQIVATGELNHTAAIQTLDITGKMVSPGFIDVHTHDDNAVLKSPDCIPTPKTGCPHADRPGRPRQNHRPRER